MNPPADAAPTGTGKHADVPTFVDETRLELDELLTQLVDRAQDVMATQGRLRGLLRANRIITSDLALPMVLRRIVEAACDLVDAEYGALGVISPDGGLEQFIHVGIDEDQAAKIGHLPEGKGLLGALIDDPRPIRTRDIRSDPRAVGFPDNHPDMRTFLGVPVRIRNDVFGNLYLTGSRRGEFSVEDEELLTSLAATAGVAIENARLYDEARRRQAWLSASTEITRQLLSSEGEDPLQVIARRVQQVADADAVNVVLPTADGDRLMVEIAVGVGAEQLTALTYPRRGSLAEKALDSGQSILSTSDTLFTPVDERIPAGGGMALPLMSEHGVRGALLVMRIGSATRFTDADLDMATTFANHAALALELADARAQQQRLALLEDRDRIARDLHDHVIQRLFATGLTVESVAAALDDDPRAARLSHAVSDIDQTIRQIRTSIFQLRGPLAQATIMARTALLDVVAEITPMLGFEPQINFAGPVDIVASGDLLDDMVAVLREALSNVARHARSSRTEVTVTATAHQLGIHVVDDGVGIGRVERRSGLANLQRRAQNHGGDLVVTAPPPSTSATCDRGTSIQWTVPLT